MSGKPSSTLSCKFCQKTQDEVTVLLAFQKDLSICDECVWLMVEIIATDNRDWRDRTIEKLKNVESKSTQA